jgi:HK97 family phage major capsid protein
MSALVQHLQRLEKMRADTDIARSAIIARAESEKRTHLTESETVEFRQFNSAIEDFDERITELRAEIVRSGRGDADAEAVRKATANSTGRRGVSVNDQGPWGRAAPLGLDIEQLRQLHHATRTGGHCKIEVERRAYSSVDSDLPPVLYPTIIGQVHESRLLNRIPVQLLDSGPSVDYVRHISSAGTPAIVAEGAVKPEVTMNFDVLNAAPAKIAAHTGVSYEIVDDFDNFVSYVTTELFREVCDVENLNLLSGPGGAGQIEGLINTSGVLTHTSIAGTGTTPTNFTALDDIEIAIAQLRTGPALASPDLLVLHPDSWSALRRTKDAYGRYLVQADPTADNADSLWGVDVLQTTQLAAGTGVLIDTSKFGRAVIRGPIVIYLGWNNDDFSRNIRRYVAEERVALAVTRPAAINIIDNLPSAA